MNDVDKCRKMEQAAPPMTEAELTELNALFPSYLFRRRKTREVWTTCCGVHAELPTTSEIMEAEHTREPEKTRYYCHHGVWSAMPPKPNPAPAACPFCGKVSPVKELGRTGNRDNLAAYRRAVVLRWYRGSLWARCYNLTKRYGAEELLTAKPGWSLRAVYRFTPGKVQRASKYSWLDQWSAYKEYDTRILRIGFKIPEYFPYCSELGMGYDIIGMEEIGKSPFRYCGAEVFLRKHPSNLLSYLGPCTACPRQVEMLTKAGMVDAVADLVLHQKINKRAFDWTETDPLKAFGLNKAEMKQFLDGGHDMDVLAAYKSLRRAKVPASFPELYDMHRRIGDTWFLRVTSRMRRCRVSSVRVMNYLEKARDEIKGTAFATAMEWWCDYIDAAELLGYDLKNPVFLFPKDLKAHHDEATKAALPFRESKRNADAAEKGRARCRSLSKRYTYSDGRWLIRPPVGAYEIVAEGKSLKHCVGGYADRHLNGKTTILFLRDRQSPGKSLVTIEMNGTKIVQIHGWDDERTACKANPKRKSPRELYAEFLGPWLAWLEAGSKRDKHGRPVMPKSKKAAGAA